MHVDYHGDVTILGPKDEPLSKAEDLTISEDRLCSRCRYFRPRWKRALKYYALWIVALAAVYVYGWEAGWIHAYWKIIGTIACLTILGGVVFPPFEDARCASRDATSVTGEKNPQCINRNLRCRFWAARK